MNNYFDVNRYTKLLELEKNGKISFFNSELLSLAASIEGQFVYNRKKEYFSLIDNYLSRVILPDDFRLKFIDMIYQDVKKASIIRKDFQKLKCFTIAPDRKQFCDPIYKILTLCHEHDDICDEIMPLMPENKFYDLVSKYYLEFEKFK